MQIFRPSPVVGETLRAITTQLSSEAGLIVDRIYAAVVDSDAAYRTLPEAHRDDVRAHIAFSLSLWFASLLDDEQPAAHALELLKAYGRRRISLGMPLDALLGAIRVGTQEVWQAMSARVAERRDLLDELVSTVCPRLLAFFDQMARSVGAAYADEQQQLPWRQGVRSALASIVFRFPDDATGFRCTCESLGIDPTIPRVALALDLTTPGMMAVRGESESERLVLSVARQMKVATEQLVGVVHQGRLIIWAPTVRGESILSSDRQMGSHAQALVRAVPDIRGVGVGLMNDGATGWAASADEALKAMQRGPCRDRANAVFLYSDLAVTDSVLATGNVLRYLNSLLERISIEPDLLSTLATYFELGQHRKLTANALGIHPNTLNYRLIRLEAILGAQLEDPGWISRLDLVLQLRRIR